MNMNDSRNLAAAAIVGMLLSLSLYKYWARRLGCHPHVGFVCLREAIPNSGNGNDDEARQGKTRQACIRAFDIHIGCSSYSSAVVLCM